MLPPPFLRIHYIRLLCILLLLTGATRGQAQPSLLKTPSIPNGYVVPMEFNGRATRIPLIRLIINGQKPQLFAVDTGCAVALVVLPRLAKLCQLQRTGVRVPITPGTGTAEIVKSPVSVQLMGLPSKPPASVAVSFAVIMDIPSLQDIQSSEPVAGLVGWPMFKQQTVCFDFAAKTLTFGAETPLAASKPGSTLLSLTTEGKIPTNLLAVPVEWDTQRMVCIIDTGRWKSQIPEALVVFQGRRQG